MRDFGFTGFVLAGGKSSRMGEDKAFLEIGGETFVERAARILAKTCGSRVSIVLNQYQTDFIGKIPVGVPHIFDVFDNRGALGGMHAAFRGCQSEWAFVLACDMPLVTEKAIKNLTRSAIQSGGKSAIVPRESDGKIQPLCAAYRVAACLPALEDFLSSQSSNRVVDFLKLVSPEFVEADALDGDINVFSNLNFPSDYRNILNQKGSDEISEPLKNLSSP